MEKQRIVGEDCNLYISQPQPGSYHRAEHLPGHNASVLEQTHEEHTAEEDGGNERVRDLHTPTHVYSPKVPGKFTRCKKGSADDVVLRRLCQRQRVALDS